MSKFKHLFEPRSIAVVGVSDDAGRPGSQAVRALLKYGYRGEIFPVNPKYREFEGLRCYGSVAEIGEDIDLVVIGVPAQGVLPVLEMCAAKRVPFAVVLSGGFRESGPEGIEREQRMLAIARLSGMRIIGPNCLGFANVHSNVYAAFGSITREPKLEPGSVSLVTQSGGFGYSIALACSEAGIGFRHVIATGNESNVDTVELVDALLDDAGTRCIVAYIEGARDGRALLDVGRRALAAGKPLLLWKAGVTEQGARAAASHTASMTGSYDFYQALFKQTGIVEIKEIHEAVDYLKALDGGKYPTGRGVAVMGVSGGSAIVFADSGEREGLQLCELGEETRQRLAKVVPDIGAVHNPIDLTAGYFSAGNQQKLETAVRAVLDDSNVASVCVNIATTGKAGSLAAAEVLSRVAQTSHKPIVVFSSAPSTETGDALRLFAESKIPVLPSPSRAAKAIAMLARYGQALARANSVSAKQGGYEAGLRPSDLLRAKTPKGSLSEADSKAVLASIGIPVTKDVLVNGLDMAVADRMTPPFVVKIVSADIPHKTEIGGVKVGIQSHAELDAGNPRGAGECPPPQARRPHRRRARVGDGPGRIRAHRRRGERHRVRTCSRGWCGWDLRGASKRLGMQACTVRRGNGPRDAGRASMPPYPRWRSWQRSPGRAGCVEGAGRTVAVRVAKPRASAGDRHQPPVRAADRGCRGRRAARPARELTPDWTSHGNSRRPADR